MSTKSNYETDSDSDPLDLDLLLYTQSENWWLDCSQQIYSVTITDKPTGAEVGQNSRIQNKESIWHRCHAFPSATIKCLVYIENRYESVRKR